VTRPFIAPTPMSSEEQSRLNRTWPKGVSKGRTYGPTEKVPGLAIELVQCVSDTIAPTPLSRKVIGVDKVRLSRRFSF
jgi:hypothetical protein